MGNEKQLTIGLEVKRSIKSDNANRSRKVVNFTTGQAIRNNEKRKAEKVRRSAERTERKERTFHADYTHSLLDYTEHGLEDMKAQGLGQAKKMAKSEPKPTERKKEQWQSTVTRYDKDKAGGRERTERTGSSVRGINRDARHTGVGHGLNGGGTRADVIRAGRWQREFKKIGNGFKQRQR